MKKRVIAFFLLPLALVACDSSDDNDNVEEDTVEMMGGDNEGEVIEEEAEEVDMVIEEEVDMVTEEEATLITYEADVAPIISTYCLECHGEVRTNGAPISFHTYELLRDHSDNVDFRMNDTFNPMPIESRGGLIEEEKRAIVTQWIVDGLLEN